MGTDSAQHVTLATASSPGVFGRAMRKVRQFACGLHGHDTLLHFEKGRMSLQCVSCGYETPGWDLKTTSAPSEPVQTRPRVVRMPLVGERRVA